MIPLGIYLNIPSIMHGFCVSNGMYFSISLREGLSYVYDYHIDMSRRMLMPCCPVTSAGQIS